MIILLFFILLTLFGLKMICIDILCSMCWIWCFLFRFKKLSINVYTIWIVLFILVIISLHRYHFSYFINIFISWYFITIWIWFQNILLSRLMSRKYRFICHDKINLRILIWKNYLFIFFTYFLRIFSRFHLTIIWLKWDNTLIFGRSWQILFALPWRPRKLRLILIIFFFGLIETLANGIRYIIHREFW